VTDRETDRRTDGWAIAYSALSICYMLSRAKTLLCLQHLIIAVTIAGRHNSFSNYGSSVVIAY